MRSLMGPFGTHVVVGDDSLAVASRANRVAEFHAGFVKALVGIESVGHRYEFRQAAGIIGMVEVENWFAVDAVVTQRLPEPLRIYYDRLIAYGKKIADSQGVG